MTGSCLLLISENLIKLFKQSKNKKILQLITNKMINENKAVFSSKMTQPLKKIETCLLPA